MKKKIIAMVLVLVSILAFAGGGWYYEENVKITLPVNEKTAIRIGKEAIEERYPEYLESVSIYKSDMQYIADEEEKGWCVWLYIDNLIGPVVYAYVENETGEVIEVGMLDEG